MTLRKFPLQILAASLLINASTIALADEVKIYNWEEYISDEILTEFTKQTGHTVKQTTYDDERTRDEVISSGRAENYDLIMIDEMTLKIYKQSGDIQNMANLNIPNRKHIDNKWQQSCTDFGLPYATGTLGLAYRNSIGTTVIDSWQQLIDPPAEHKGRISIIMDDIDTVAAALMAHNHDPFSEDTAELKKSYAALKRLKTDLLTTDYALPYALEHGGSQMSMALVYSSDLYSLREATKQDDWVYVVPKEGSIMWLDCLVMPSGHSPSEATLAFLNFINQPKVAIKNAEEIWFTTTNTESLAYASKDYLADTELFPPAAVINKSTTYKTLSIKSLKLRNKIISTLEH